MQVWNDTRTPRETDMTLTIDQPAIAAIRAVLDAHALRHGVGDADSMCSVAAINIGLSGVVGRDCPACMSPVIHEWIVGVQDVMPIDMINAAEWKRFLPYAAGTGRNHEVQRLDMISNWMRAEVLPQLQPTADSGGFGAEWRNMCAGRTDAAMAQAEAAVAWAAWTTALAVTADPAVAWASWASCAWVYAGMSAAWVTAPAFWLKADPTSLLHRLVLVSVSEQEVAS